MVQHPLGAVEVRWRFGPVLVVGAEPPGPLAVGLSGEQSGEPGGPYVGVFSGLGHEGGLPRDAFGRSGLPSSVRVVASLWSTGCCHQIGRGLSRSEPVSAVFGTVLCLRDGAVDAGRFPFHSGVVLTRPMIFWRLGVLKSSMGLGYLCAHDGDGAGGPEPYHRVGVLHQV